MPAKRFNLGFRVDSESDPLPLLSVFIDNMHVDEVQINGGVADQRMVCSHSLKVIGHAAFQAAGSRAGGVHIGDRPVRHGRQGLGVR